MGETVPHESLVYRALELVPPYNAKVVIVGADPYPDANLATGLAFDLTGSQKITPSLRNIYKELEDDLGIKRQSLSLMDWVNQDVLLLNRTLTVEEGKPGSHYKEWKSFTEYVIRLVNASQENVVFMLWGRVARELASLIYDEYHCVLEASHPSPLGAYRGFFGCKHFSKCNNYLVENNIEPIKWED